MILKCYRIFFQLGLLANVLLDARDPSAAEGQKYALNFVVYTGSTGIESKTVIKTGGVWLYKE